MLSSTEQIFLNLPLPQIQERSWRKLIKEGITVLGLFIHHQGTTKASQRGKLQTHSINQILNSKTKPDITNMEGRLLEYSLNLQHTQQKDTATYILITRSNACHPKLKLQVNLKWIHDKKNSISKHKCFTSHYPLDIEEVLGKF